MKAIIVKKYGDEHVMAVTERNKPILEAHDLLIKMKATSLSPVDMAFRKGEPFVSRLFTGLSKPKYDIPGDIVAGVIEAVGSEVSRFKVGDRVYGHAGLTFGAQASYLKLKEDEAIIKMPDHMSFEEAAGFAYSGMTAIVFMRDHFDVKENTKVLINGASGAIGTFALQMAKNKGAYVVTTSSSENFEMLKDLGADKTIDYKNDLSNSTDHFDLVFDVPGKSSFKDMHKRMNSGGLYMSTVPDFPLMLRTLFKLKKHGKSSKFVATGLRKTPDKIKDLQSLSLAYEKGQLKCVIDRVFEMDDIVKAHHFVENGRKKGNTIIKID